MYKLQKIEIFIGDRDIGSTGWEDVFSGSLEKILLKSIVICSRKMYDYYAIRIKSESNKAVFHKTIKNEVNWDYISENLILQENFIIEFEEYVDFERISQYQKLSKKSLIRFSHRLNWEFIFTNKYINLSDMQICSIKLALKNNYSIRYVI